MWQHWTGRRGCICESSLRQWWGVTDLAFNLEQINPGTNCCFQSMQVTFVRAFRDTAGGSLISHLTLNKSMLAHTQIHIYDGSFVVRHWATSWASAQHLSTRLPALVYQVIIERIKMGWLWVSYNELTSNTLYICALLLPIRDGNCQPWKAVKKEALWNLTVLNMCSLWTS